MFDDMMEDAFNGLIEEQIGDKGTLITTHAVWSEKEDGMPFDVDCPYCNGHYHIVETSKDGNERNYLINPSGIPDSMVNPNVHVEPFKVCKHFNPQLISYSISRGSMSRSYQIVFIAFGDKQTPEYHERVSKEKEAIEQEKQRIIDEQKARQDKYLQHRRKKPAKDQYISTYLSGWGGEYAHGGRSNGTICSHCWSSFGSSEMGDDIPCGLCGNDIKFETQMYCRVPEDVFRDYNFARKHTALTKDHICPECYNKL